MFLVRETKRNAIGLLKCALWQNFPKVAQKARQSCAVLKRMATNSKALPKATKQNARGQKAKHKRLYSFHAIIAS